MAALTKIAQNIFGVDAGTDEISKFGSLAAGSEAFTTDPAQAQSLSNWLDGWYSAVIGGNAPTIQDMNSVFFVITYQLAYLVQRGVAEWDAVTTYYTGSIVNVAGVLYVSLQDTNTNHATTDSTWWKAQVQEPIGTGRDYWGANLPSGYVWASGKTIGNASSNGTERANADTLALFTLFWTDFNDSTLPIYTSAGIASTRGASAAIDFAANKAISVPDKRGRVSAGKDDLGGTAASRLTTTGLGASGTVLGNAGGGQTQTLTSAQMPTHTHTQDAHSHGVTDPGHYHATRGTTVTGSGSNTFQLNSDGPDGQTQAAITGITLQNSTPAINTTGGGGAHENVQPTIVCNYIIKL